MSELVLAILELFHRIEVAILYLVAVAGVIAVVQLARLGIFLRDRRRAAALKQERLRRADDELRLLERLRELM